MIKGVAFVKTTRLVIGIISMVLFVLIALQSCVAGVGNTLEQAGETSGSSGLFLAVFMLIAGIVGVAARKSKGGTITSACFYIVGGLIGIANVGSYADLKIWSILSIIFGIIFIITVIFDKKPKETT